MVQLNGARLASSSEPCQQWQRVRRRKPNWTPYKPRRIPLATTTTGFSAGSSTCFLTRMTALPDLTASVGEAVEEEDGEERGAELCVSAACTEFRFIPFSGKKRLKNDFFNMAQKLGVFWRFIFSSNFMLLLTRTQKGNLYLF